ncbi:Abi family protein, partial [bacterium]
MLGSWLRSLNFVRNVIAHHSRLWNLNLVDNPSLPRHQVIPVFDPLLNLPGVSTRIYSICCIFAYLSKVLDLNSKWYLRLRTKINEFPRMPHARIQDMGFPSDWEGHDFWN